MQSPSKLQYSDAEMVVICDIAHGMAHFGLEEAYIIRSNNMDAGVRVEYATVKAYHDSVARCLLTR